jgi:elongation factor G
MASIALEKVRNIGISAHIDSGKTTLSERILFYTGKIHKIEEVRGKSGVGAKMDSMDLEREKGITIQSAATYCEWNGYNINLIDTPGTSTSPSRSSARCASSTAPCWCCAAPRACSRSRTPSTGRCAATTSRASPSSTSWTARAPTRRASPHSCKEKLRHNTITTQLPIGEEANFEGIIDLIRMKAMFFDGDSGEDIREEEISADRLEEAKTARHDMIAAVADHDDELAELFLAEQEPTIEQLRAAIRRATISLKMTPVFIGSAYKNKGVQLMLDGVTQYLPNPKEVQNIALDQDKGEEKVILEHDPKKPFVGLAFKLEDGKYGQLTYMRLYQGTLSKGDFIVNNSSGRKRVKVPRLVRMHSAEMNDIESAQAGDIVALFGVECSSGDTFTAESLNYTMTSMHVPDSVISLAVSPKDKTNTQNFSKALNRFTKEDPTFRVHRDEESAQTIIRGMGELHLEIYIERMKREYGVEVISGKPQVAYREAMTQKSEFSYTHKKQTGGSGSTARWRATSSRCRRNTRRATSSSTRSSAGRFRASSSRLRQGLPRGHEEGAAHRVPHRRRPLPHQRRFFTPGRFVRNRVPHRGPDGLPRGLRKGQADHPRADHARRGAVPRGVPGSGARARSISAAAPSSRRRSWKASSRRWPRCR